MNVIFHADDAGVSYGTNEAVIKAHTDGVLTSTSIRTNGVRFGDMVEKIKKHKKLGVGIHLNLTDGNTHLNKLAGVDGLYRNTFFTYFIRLQILNDKTLLHDCIDELRFQFEMIKREGLRPDHVDGQDHIHMIPVLFNEVAKLCKEYQISAIRVSYEPLHFNKLTDFVRMFLTGGVLKRAVLSILSLKAKRIAKKNNLLFPNAFYGVLYTSKMDTKTIQESILDATKRKFETIEVALHPAFPNFKGDTKYTSPYFTKYSNQDARQQEFDTLTDEKLMSFIKNKSISLVTFSSL